MATDVQVGRRDARPGGIFPGRLVRAGISQNTWAQAALIAGWFFVLYFMTGNMSDPYDQYVRLADAMLDGRLYVLHPPDYLELARYYDNGLPCTGAEVGCKGYVIDPPAPAVLLLPFVAIFGAGLNQVLVSMAFGAAAGPRQSHVIMTGCCGDTPRLAFSRPDW